MSSPKKPDKSGTDWRESFRDASPYLGLGMQLAFSMAFFTLGGYFLDRWLDTLPWLTIAGGVLGMIAVFVQLVRTTQQMSADDRQRARKPARRGAGHEQGME